MASTPEFIAYVCKQIKDVGEIRFRKMFGEYIIYVNNKPVIIVCDNVAFVKKLPCLQEMMQNVAVGCPYDGAKEHYVLDLENPAFCKTVISELEKVTPLPKSRKKK